MNYVLNHLIIVSVLLSVGTVIGYNSVSALISDGSISLIKTDTSWRSSWSNIIPVNLNDDGITDLLFYSPTEHTGEFYTVTSSGTLNLVKTHKDFPTLLRKIVPINLNNDDSVTDILTDYQVSVALKSVNSSGIIKTVKAFGLSAPIIVPVSLNHDKVTDLLYYDPGLHKGLFYTLTTNGTTGGSFNLIASHSDWRSSWSDIIPINLNNDDITDLLFYSPSEGTGEFYTVTSSGTLNLVATHTDWRSSWSKIIPINLNNDGITDLLFYSPTEHTGEFYTVTSSGQMQLIKTDTSWRSSWSNIIPVNLNNDGITDLLFYSPSEGTGEFYQMSAYQPNTDLDHDTLPNSWEIFGVDKNNDNRIDYVLPNANPRHKDLYVEVDFMQFHRPWPTAINDVVSSFLNAPLSNPDGVVGINLHVEVDEEIPHIDTTNNLELFVLRSLHFGTASERADLNHYDILSAKTLVYHYGLFAHSQPGTTTSGWTLSIPGMTFMVTLGGWRSIDPSTGHQVGSIDQQEGTFMHELGHSLGLKHGGGDDDNCKPNYLSVMSYSRQMRSMMLDRPLDYSESKINPLDENSLNEATGISASVPPNLETIYGPNALIGIAGDPIDWNGDGDTSDSSVVSDINYISTRDHDDCASSAPTIFFDDILFGHDDWNNLVYRSTVSHSFTNSSGVGQELTFEMIREQRLALLRGIEFTIKSLPVTAFKSAEDALDLRLNFSSTIHNSTHGLESLLKTDKLDDAIIKLKNLKSKADYALASNVSNDLVTASGTQGKIQHLLENLIGILEMQSNASKGIY